MGHGFRSSTQPTVTNSQAAVSVGPNWALNNSPRDPCRFTEESSLHFATSSGISQVGSGKVNISENCTIQYCPRQISTTQVSIGQINSAQISTTQVTTPKDSVAQVNIVQISTTQISSAKIPRTSSITLQQLLSSHNYTFPASHNFSLQNTTVPTWTSFLTGTTPFNLNIEVTDFPTGQLAIAQLTSFATNGTPNADTLLLDLDGNGWFTDSTP